MVWLLALPLGALFPLRRLKGGSEEDIEVGETDMIVVGGLEDAGCPPSVWGSAAKAGIQISGLRSNSNQLAIPPPGTYP